MDDKVWVEVTYTVTVVEERTVLLDMNTSYNGENKEWLMRIGMDVAKRSQTDCIAKADKMKLKRINRAEPKIESFFFDDGKGNPDPNSRFKVG